MNSISARWRTSEPLRGVHKAKHPAFAAPTPAPTQVVVVETREEDPVESEYIYNLQQQVYFLELEARYLRERRDKCHTCQDKGEEEQEQNLKAKLEDLHRISKQETKRREETVQRVAEERQVVAMKMQQLLVEVEELARHPERTLQAIGKEKEEVSAATIAAETKLRELQNRMHRCENDLERYTKVRDEGLHRIDTLRASINAHEDDLENLLGDLQTVETYSAQTKENAERTTVRLRDLRYDMEKHSGSLSAAEEEQLKHLVASIELEVRQYQNRLKQIESSHLSQQHSQTDFINVSVMNEEKIADLERAISKEHSRAVPPSMQGENNVLSQKVEALEDALRSLHRQCEDDEKIEQQIRRETRDKKKQLVETNSQIDQIHRRMGLQQHRIAVISEENDRLEREIRRMVRDEKMHHTTVARREEDIQERLQHIAKYEVLVRKLEGQLGDKAYERVDVSMFEGLLQANMQVAQNFQALVHALKR